MRIEFEVDEFVSAREAARGFSNLVARLRDGEVEKFVVVNRNKPTAVLLSIEAYAELAERAERDRA